MWPHRHGHVQPSLSLKQGCGLVGFVLGKLIWRSKQFCRWGHKLAQGAPGKGHGSRAFLHTLRHGVTIHDASYWLALELSGPNASVTSLLTSLWLASRLWHCGPISNQRHSSRATTMVHSLVSEPEQMTFDSCRCCVQR